MAQICWEKCIMDKTFFLTFRRSVGDQNKYLKVLFTSVIDYSPLGLFREASNFTSKG